MTLPPDYVERVYAGVLGKMIGVYLGRPFEGWTYDRIMAELGEITYYVHEKRGVPLIVTDDDLSGTFTFVRALHDYGYRRDLTPAQIGQTWLNYLVEGKTVLWWGGLGNSTEHTAYLRLKSGIPAPRSGSIETNGPIVAQQIGAQIFIDGWAMVAPGDPELAADLARRAASVSHDGEAIYGAQVLAAMEALAFVETDRDCLLEAGTRLIPQDSLIYRMIGDLREWHGQEPDWRKARERIAARYGYDRYIGGCHMIPNHALIILGFLWGEDDFGKSLMITNTSGWDTDCNSGNLGCLMGIKNGLAGIAGADGHPQPDWRGPLADRLYLPTADGGRAVTDAVNETYHLVNAGRALAGEAPLFPKGGARFHFELPGSVQGFLAAQGEGLGRVVLSNVPGRSPHGTRSLGIQVTALAEGQAARVATATFVPPEAVKMPGYGLLASPTLYPGQTVIARLEAEEGNQAPGKARLFIQAYGAEDMPVRFAGPDCELGPGSSAELSWRIPDTGGAPIFEIGLELGSAGLFYLDYLTWAGAPEVRLDRPAGSSLPWPGPKLWRSAWINAVDQWEIRAREPYRVIQNRGRGMLFQGARAWKDYTAIVRVAPALVKAGGIAARVQGLMRFYALQLCEGGVARLVKALDGDAVLAETPFPWERWQPTLLALEVTGGQGGQPARLRAWADGRLLFDVEDARNPLDGGGVALVVEEGHLLAEAVEVRPAG
jgi:ADP-ribosylglycohydrolase